MSANRVTMRDVAKEAGVTSAAVSYALSGKRPISEETRRRVEQAIERLYHGQNEESFWALMGALNYALELETHVLVPLQTAPGTPPTPKL